MDNCGTIGVITGTTAGLLVLVGRGEGGDKVGFAIASMLGRVASSIHSSREPLPLLANEVLAFDDSLRSRDLELCSLSLSASAIIFQSHIPSNGHLCSDFDEGKQRLWILPNSRPTP